MGNEEFDITGGPEVAYTSAAEMSDETDIRYEDASDEDENQWCGPGGDLVGSDAMSCE